MYIKKSMESYGKVESSSAITCTLDMLQQVYVYICAVCAHTMQSKRTIPTATTGGRQQVSWIINGGCK